MLQARPVDLFRKRQAPNVGNEATKQTTPPPFSLCLRHPWAKQLNAFLYDSQLQEGSLETTFPSLGDIMPQPSYSAIW